MKLVNIILQPFIFFILFAFFFILLVPISIVALPFKRLTRFKMTAIFWRTFFQITIAFLTLGRSVKIDRRDEISQSKISPEGLYIANHQSFLDIPMLFSTTIMPPIMKKSLIYIPIFGLCAYSAGAIIVNRRKKSSRKKALKLAMTRLNSGLKNMMYYPEGSRTRAGLGPKEFSNIKTPIMKYAYETGVSIYPVSIYGTNKIIDKNIISLGKKTGVIFHEELKPSDFENVDEFVQACWEKVRSGYKELEEKIG